MNNNIFLSTIQGKLNELNNSSILKTKFTKYNEEINEILSVVNRINDFIQDNDLDKRLLIEGENRNCEEYTNENVLKTIEEIKKDLDKLFSSKDALECSSLSKEIGSNIQYLIDYQEKYNLLMTKIKELKEEISFLSNNDNYDILVFKQKELDKIKNQKKISKEKREEINTDIDEILMISEEINKYVLEKELDHRLLIVGNNNIDSEYTEENIRNTISLIREKLDKLFSSKKAFECASLSEEIGSNIQYLKDFQEFYLQLDNKQEELENEISYYKVLLEDEKMNNSRLQNSIDFSDSFVLYKSLEKRDYCKNYYHSFSYPNCNLIIKHNQISTSFVSSIYENIFMRLLYKFNCTILNVQPIGFLPVGLNALIKNIDNIQSEVFNSSIIGDTTHFFTNLYNIMTERAEKYYADGDFEQYNKNHPSSLDKAIIVFIYNYPKFVPESSDIMIEYLLNEECHKYGIFFIVDYCTDLDTNGKRIDFSSNEKFKCFEVRENVAYYNDSQISFDLSNDKSDRRQFFSDFRDNYEKDTTKSSNDQESFELESSEEEHLEQVPQNEDENIFESNEAEEEIGTNDLNIRDGDTKDFSEKLVIPVGKDNEGKDVSVSFEIKNEKCSMIVAGGTGSGKSEFLHTLILSACLKYSPEQLNIFLIDFKDGVEFAPYSKNLAIPHIKLISCRNSVNDALMILEEIKNEKIRRNNLFKDNNCANISQFNNNNPDKKMPRLLVIIDEYQVMMGNDRTSSRCSELLESLAREVRSVGISLILSSQTVACDNSVLAQITNRLCLKVKDGSLSKLIESLNDSDRDKLNSNPNKGVGYFSNGEEVIQLQVNYSGETDRTDGTGKDKYIKLIKQKYNNKIDFILSNDQRNIYFEEIAENNKDDDKADFGLLVFNNNHLKMPFSLEADVFSNPFFLGDKQKSFDIEYAIINCLLNKEQKYDLGVFTFKSRNSSDLEKKLMDKAEWSSYDVSELIQKVDSLYEEYHSRAKIKGKGELFSGDVKLLVINSFDKTIIERMESEVNKENNNSTDMFAWDKKEKESTIGKLIDLYNYSYKYGIYLLIHFDTVESIKNLFEYNLGCHIDNAIYLDDLAVNYYISKSFDSSSAKVELEDKTSIYVKDNVAYKFRRYTFK